MLYGKDVDEAAGLDQHAYGAIVVWVNGVLIFHYDWEYWCIIGHAMLICIVFRCLLMVYGICSLVCIDK